MHESILFYLNALPESLLNIIAVIIFFGSDMKNLRLKLLLFGLGDAAISTIIALFTWSFALSTIINIPLSVLFLYLLLRRKWWLSLKIFVAYYMFLLFSYIVAILCTAYALKLSPIQTVTYPALDTWVWFFSYLTSLGMSFPLRRLRPAFLEFFAKLEDTQYIVGFHSLWIVLLLQVSILLAFFGDLAFRHNFIEAPGRGLLILTVFLILLGSTIFILTRALHIAETRASSETQQAVTENLMNLVTSVRSQRHDFVNHIQVIRSLMQMNKYKELNRYVTQLSSEITQLNDMLNFDNPFLGALLNMKITAAEMRGIKMDLNIQSWLDTSSLDSRNLDLVRIMGNLIDNSIEAVEQFDVPEKWVRVMIGEKDSCLFFMVTNPCCLPLGISDEVFEPGFSTKDDGHSGLGLYISKQLSAKLHGDLRQSIDPEGNLVFTVLIPK